MRREVVIRPEAESDIGDAYAWYEKQREGLGFDFLLCVEETIDRIRETPEAYPRVHKQARRALIRRFPYGVFYIVETDKVVVVAVYHGRRDPKGWRARI